MASVVNLGRLLSDTARRLPDWPALIETSTPEHRTTTWRQFDDGVNAFAAGLAGLGLKKGDRLFVLSRNNRPMAESPFAAFKRGLVWVPANFRLTAKEVAWLAAHSGARAMLYDPAFAEAVDAAKAEAPALQHIIATEAPRPGELAYEDLVRENAGAPSVEVEVEPDDPLWFFYTSGTTGRPKAGVLTHGQMAFVVLNHIADLMPGLDESHVSLVVAPLSHGAGAHLLPNVARGAATVLMPSERLDADVAWALVERYGVSNMFTVPTIVKRLVEDPSVDAHDHSSLRHIIYAGAPMYREDQKLALQKLGRVLVQYYGLGEVTGNITVLPAAWHREDDAAPDARIGSCGYPRTGMEIAIRDPDGKRLGPGEAGEITVKGPAVFAGYHDNEEATAKALKGGWFYTGDLGRVDEAGFLYITGRASDMYISGGSNVYPRDAEEVLLAHEAVAEVAVLGVPDPKWGESGVAVVVPAPGAKTDEASLLASLDGKLSKYKWPRRVFFWEELPKSGYGKVPKHLIRQELYARGDLVEGQGP